MVLGRFVFDFITSECIGHFFHFTSHCLIEMTFLSVSLCKCYSFDWLHADLIDCVLFRVIAYYCIQTYKLYAIWIINSPFQFSLLHTSSDIEFTCRILSLGGKVKCLAWDQNKKLDTNEINAFSRGLPGLSALFGRLKRLFIKQFKLDLVSLKPDLEGFQQTVSWYCISSSVQASCIMNL